jgi:DNA invertase Pin-like site-specific DNA recombinase
MKTNMQWALYARKSTESEDRQVQSIDDQIKYLTAIAHREGLHIAETMWESKSAKEPENRKEFKRLLTLIEKGQVQGILCWKLDRLSRNPIDSARIQWFLQTGKIKCIKACDRTYLPEDNALVLAVETGMANQYVRDLAKNVKRGLESKAQKGWYPAIPPIGYLNTKKGQKGLEEIIIDPERFHTVRKMWDLMLTGNYTAMEVRRIATTEWKLDTPKRRFDGKRPIAESYIYTLFSNIFYTGNFVYAGKFYEGKHPAMVTMAEFEKMQIILSKKGQPRPKVHDFPFTGIMHCTNCGASITATEKTKLVKSKSELKTYTYYHCTHHVGIDNCYAPPVSLTNLEWQIEKLIRQNSIGKAFYDYGISLLKANEGNQANHYEAIYERQLQYVHDLQKKLDRLLGFLLNETINEEEYGAQKKGVERQLAIEKVKLSQCEAESANYEKYIQNAFIFSRVSLHAFKNGDIQTRREVLASLGSNHQLNDKNLSIDLHSWLAMLKSGEDELLPEIERLELKESNDSNAKGAFNSFSPLMCALVDRVRTELKKSPHPPHIPDLSKWIDTTT